MSASFLAGYGSFHTSCGILAVASANSKIRTRQKNHSWFNSNNVGRKSFKSSPLCGLEFIAFKQPA